MLESPESASGLGDVVQHAWRFWPSRRRIRSVLRAVAFLAPALLADPMARAAAPEVFRNSYYESPVQGGPDDLLFLGGLGFESHDRVVYQVVRSGTSSSGHPDTVPERSTRELGTASIVKVGDPPYSLTIQLPGEMSADEVYRLWVVNRALEWSQAFTINDARPLWVSPAYVYATKDFAGLGRRVRVIGRNLGPLGTARSLRIRLQGPHTYIVTSDELAERQSTLQHYVAEAALPREMVPGSYAVSISRDGRDWTEVPEQKLAVLADLPALPRFDISDPRFGACRANDGADDSGCLAKAIGAAKQAGGGVISVPAGTWDLYPAAASMRGEGDFTLSDNIHLEGAGAKQTKIVRHDPRERPIQSALFLLEGNNSVTRLQFMDERHFDSFEHSRPVIRLGHSWDDPQVRDAQPPASVRRIVISANRFRHVGMAVESGGLPIEQLFVTHNDFGGYARDLEMPGSRWSVRNSFRIDDAVIRWNRFVPGSYVDVKVRQGVIATGLGASRRVDFSSNDADGGSVEALQDAADPPGWRAAFFWNMSNNSEYLLVADNRISCPGDKAGDGEAIAFDSNGDTEAYHGAQPVAAANVNSISVEGTPVPQQNGLDIDRDSYYVGYWIQVVDGPGIGQTRRITGYESHRDTHTVLFHVSAAWDVIPAAGQSRVIITRQYWQAYVVANEVTQSAPTCKKANLNGPRGGLIILAGPSIDSVVDHNRQYDTDGISVAHGYSVHTASCAQCGDQATFQSALEIRDNLIDGEYDWSSDCSDSGLRALFGAAPTPDAPPPTLSFGLQFSHNVISRADALRGGAINVVPTWFAGPEPQRWRLIENLVVSHNLVKDVNGPPPQPSCHRGQRGRPGIRIEGTDNVRDAVLYKNTCERVDVPLQDSGLATARVCPAEGGSSCECPAAIR
jgi:hypothetical protein